MTRIAFSDLTMEMIDAKQVSGTLTPAEIAMIPFLRAGFDPDTMPALNGPAWAVEKAEWMRRHCVRSVISEMLTLSGPNYREETRNAAAAVWQEMQAEIRAATNTADWKNESVAAVTEGKFRNRVIAMANPAA